MQLDRELVQVTPRTKPRHSVRAARANAARLPFPAQNTFANLHSFVGTERYRLSQTDSATSQVKNNTSSEQQKRHDAVDDDDSNESLR